MLLEPLTEWSRENAWILDYHDEIVGDLSAVHRVDDWRLLSFARLFTLIRHLVQHPSSSVRRQLLADIARENEAAESSGSADAMLAQLAAEGWAERG